MASTDPTAHFPPDPSARSPQERKNAATGATAASIRAFTQQLIAFYFRAPAKAFLRTRLDYMALPRAINPRALRGESWSFKQSTPALLAHAVREHGWSFLPHQVLPPLLANLAVGATLYTSYLGFLALFHAPSAAGARRTYPPVPVTAAMAAGAAAGGVTSMIAAPLDALAVRFRAADVLGGRYAHVWAYAGQKLREIGVRGVFAGWGLGFAKDVGGNALFFGVFEGVKSQGYFAFVTRWYGRESGGEIDKRGKMVIRPHYAIEPAFILGAGVAASIAQAVVQYPIQIVQNVHYDCLEQLDHQAQKQPSKRRMLRLYYRAYEETFAQCKELAVKAGGWRPWLYRGIVWSTIRQTPSTSAGLVVFELVRRKYATGADVVRIHKDGFDIELT